jgi:hypothetical protein
VRTTSTLSTKTAAAGEEFVATLEEPLVEGNWVVAPRGARVSGRVIESSPGGRVKGRAMLTVGLTSITSADGRPIAISTSALTKEAQASKKKDALKVGIGAGIGAAVGAIAGGGKGAAIGSAAGGGAGAATVLATQGDPAVIPAESLLTFRLSDSVRVTER